MWQDPVSREWEEGKEEMKRKNRRGKSFSEVLEGEERKEGGTNA